MSCALAIHEINTRPHSKVKHATDGKARRLFYVQIQTNCECYNNIPNKSTTQSCPLAATQQRKDNTRFALFTADLRALIVCGGKKGLRQIKKTAQFELQSNNQIFQVRIKPHIQ